MQLGALGLNAGKTVGSVMPGGPSYANAQEPLINRPKNAENRADTACLGRFPRSDAELPPILVTLRFSMKMLFGP